MAVAHAEARTQATWSQEWGHRGTGEDAGEDARATSCADAIPERRRQWCHAPVRHLIAVSRGSDRQAGHAP